MAMPAKEGFDATTTARSLVRAARRGALATRDSQSGIPYASLVGVATAADGAPLLFISKLARHTRNIAADPRVSLMVDDAASGDPLAGARVTLWGRLDRCDDAQARRRYFDRQVAARFYADFPDFALYRLVPEGAHLVAGFGRIVDLAPADLLTDLSGADRLLGAEPDIVEHMNADHRDTLDLYAERLAGSQPGPWRFEGCDPEGFEIGQDGKAIRLRFPDKARTPGDVRKSLAAMAEAARQAVAPTAQTGQTNS